MTVAILGHGNVGGALARALNKAGVRVVIALAPDRSNELPSWISEHGIETLPAPAAIEPATVTILAVPYPAVESLVTSLRSELRGKVVIDCTNPVAADLSHGLGSERSGSEVIQSLLPESRIAKCFSIYGFENFEQPPTSCMDPAMLIATDDDSAKEIAIALAEKTGWRGVHVGPLSQALHLEHMTLLWIKMVRVLGMPTKSVWALVQE